MGTKLIFKAAFKKPNCTESFVLVAYFATVFDAVTDAPRCEVVFANNLWTVAIFAKRRGYLWLVEGKFHFLFTDCPGPPVMEMPIAKPKNASLKTAFQSCMILWPIPGLLYVESKLESSMLIGDL